MTLRRWIAGATLALLAAASAGAAEPAKRFVMIGADGSTAAFADAAGVRREGDRAVMPVLFVSSDWAGTGDRDLNFAITQVSYDCKGRTTQLISAEAFNSRGEVFASNMPAGQIEALDPNDGGQYAGFAIACGLPDAPTTPVFGSAMEAVAWRRSTPNT